MGTALNVHERKALQTFLVLYTGSALLLMSMIAFLYYSKEIVAIQDQCSIQMRYAASSVKEALMHAEMEKKPYQIALPNAALHVGLFDEKGELIESNLENSRVVLTQSAYKSATHEYHVEHLHHPVAGISYIVIENAEGKKEKEALIFLVLATLVASSIFIAFIGYLLSRMLLKPIKDRMAHLNDFIKDSAHEINTPVSALMMSVSSLRNHEGVPNRTLNHISISAKRIFEIYNSLSFLAFNDRDLVVDESFDLALSIHESVKFFEEIAALKENTFTCKLEQTPVFMDKSRAQKLINNLVSNAIKYSYPQTVIHIELLERTLCVRNEGEGIKEGDLEAIFRRYERRSKTEGGFGIGLDIVQTLCKTYGLHLNVTSTPKESTAFCLSFPPLS